MAEREPVGADGAARPARPNDMPAPQDAYGRSKLAAERALWAVCEASGLEGVVVRPPLVHGPGAKGNLALLMAAVARGWPLPLAGIDNARSLVSSRNLADLLALCAVDPRAVGGTWLVADGPGVGTEALVRTIAAAMARPARLVRVPRAALRLAAALDRRGRIARLTESFRVDDSDTRARLGWRPPQSFADGIAEMVAAHRGTADGGWLGGFPVEGAGAAIGFALRCRRRGTRRPARRPSAYRRSAHARRRPSAR